MTTDSKQEALKSPERLWIHAGANVETKACGCGGDVEYVRADLTSRASVAAVGGDALLSAMWEALKREACKSSYEAKTVVFLGEEKFRKAMAPFAAASSPAPAEVPLCGPARPDDGSECLYGACPRPRDGCSEYCWQHHESQCQPLQPQFVSDVDRWKHDLIEAGWTEESATAWYSPEGGLYRGPFGAWKELQRRNAPLQPEGEQEK